ncbi:HNH endonuclease [Phenylobacterium sp. VNQ135]|uniref:HNH endonuclease n=1 Tax=Phenylobacterium sp. VNQ135 TaxID=3400922 RepID=UPI003C01D46A
MSKDDPDKIIRYPSNRAIVLRNLNCVYCGRRFGDGLNATKEHVIGRRFVPRGCFDGQWNLIANACGGCNGDKSDLEDDISAISMLPDLGGRYAIDDHRLVAEAARKAANARSRRTKKVVADSQEEISFQQQFGGGTFTFNFTAPPQVTDQRIFKLAHYHFRGFFFLITYQEETRLGGFVPGQFIPLVAVRRNDWGNPQMRWFMDLVRDWDLRLHAIGADGFFKFFIRRHPEGHEVWAWAAEWNHCMRVVGFVGDETIIRELVRSRPEILFDTVHQDAKRTLRMRIDQALSEEEDDLFSGSYEDEEAG